VGASRRENVCSVLMLIGMVACARVELLAT
jgi:hypothetical protein